MQRLAPLHPFEHSTHVLDNLLQTHCAAAPCEGLWPMITVPLPCCREWTEDGQLWVQYVSSTPATRLDVITLQEKLDQQLQQRQVRMVAPYSSAPYCGEST